MSQVIQHLAEPIIDELEDTFAGDTLENVEAIITLVISAWNLTLVSPAERDKEFQREARSQFGPDLESAAIFSWICDVVEERKQRFYPHLNNAIIDVRFTHEAPDSMYFEIVSLH